MEDVVAHIMKHIDMSKDEFEVINPNFYSALRIRLNLLFY